MGPSQPGSSGSNQYVNLGDPPRPVGWVAILRAFLIGASLLGALWVLAWDFSGRPDKSDEWFEITRTVVFGFAALGVLPAAYVGYRRQRTHEWELHEGRREQAHRESAEQTRRQELAQQISRDSEIRERQDRRADQSAFQSRYGATAEQLGAPTAVQRLAGVYAMAALADDWDHQRQQCIDVLCAYLRLPYDPTSGALKEAITERTWPTADVSNRESKTHAYLPNDREVRMAIISVLRSHLHESARVPWIGYDLNLSGAVFDGGDFTGARFDARRVSFAGAHFVGGTIQFDSVKFVGEVDFSGAQFVGGSVSFKDATFDQNSFVPFYSAEFRGGEITFGSASVEGTVAFDDCTFAGSSLLLGMRISAGSVTFNESRFERGDLLFRGAEISGGSITFTRAEFGPDSTVSFIGVTPTGGTVSFDWTKDSVHRSVFVPRTSNPRFTRDGVPFTGRDRPETDGQ